MNASGGPNPKYVATLALAAVLILTVGWLIRPRDETTAPTALPSEGELARLARLSERRSLENMTAYFSGVAEDVDASVVRAPSGETSGLVWNETTIVSARASEPGDAAAGLPVSAMRRPNAALALAPVHRRETPIEPGDWVVAVWRTRQGRAFAMGNAMQTVPLTCGTVATREVLCSLPFTETMTGGGLFDAAGELIGVIASCGGHLAAITPDGVDAMLTRAATAEQQLLVRFGLVAGPLSPDESAYFDATDGMLVREVWIGSAADAAGLEPGDVILSVDGAGVARLEDLAPLAAPERKPVTLALRRARGPLAITVPPPGAAPVPKSGPAPTAGLLWEAPVRGFRVDQVAPDSAASRAGITSGDRLTRIDGAVPRSEDQAGRLLAAVRSHPVFVTVVRGQRRIGLVLH